jgi:hypothetical protein
MRLFRRRLSPSVTAAHGSSALPLLLHATAREMVLMPTMLTTTLTTVQTMAVDAAVAVLEEDTDRTMLTAAMEAAATTDRTAMMIMI